METRGCAGHTGSGQHRHLQQDTEELSQMVQNMWRPCLHGASRLGAHGRVWGDHPGVSVPRRHSCELSRDGTTHQRRFAEDEGRPEGNGWFRHHRTGITAASRYLQWPIPLLGATNWNLLDSDGDGYANGEDRWPYDPRLDRKSTRLNSSHT